MRVRFSMKNFNYKAIIIFFLFIAEVTYGQPAREIKQSTQSLNNKAIALSIKKIGDTLGFTMDELVLNRKGKISPHQKTEILKQAISMSGMVFIAFGLIIILFLVVKPRGFRRIMFSLLSLIAISIFIMLAWGDIQDSINHKVVMAEGKLEFKAAGRGVSLIIGHYRGVINNNAYTVLSVGKSYRVYYLFHSNHFLSIEPLPYRFY